MKRKLRKCLILISLIFFLFLPILGVPAQTHDDDSSIGNLTYDTVNDAPVFIDVYNTSDLITPNEDVLFYAVIQDIDNTSAQLNVTLYYSYSIFNFENHSFEMSYASLEALQTYRFEHNFVGKTSGTSIIYYYQVFDGETIVREGYPLYYDLQWSVPPVVVERPLPDKQDYEREIPDVTRIAIVMISLVGLVSIILLLMAGTRKREPIKS